MASAHSHLEKVEGNMSSVTKNSYGNKKTTQNQSGITGSDESSDSSFSPKDNRKASSPEDKPSLSTRETEITKKKDKKKRKSPAVSNESSFGASSFATKSASKLHKKEKLQDDTAEDDGEHGLTTPKGQMALTPNMTEEQAKADAKREHNRRNAARARKRSKHMVGGLQEKVHSLTKWTEDLQRSNEMLTAQLKVLRTQNRVLLASSEDTGPKVQVQVQSSSSNDILSQLLEQLQGNNGVQQQGQGQGQDIIRLLNTLGGQGSSSQYHITLQGGQQAGAGNLLSGMQGQGNAQLLSVLLGQSQSQAQQQIPRQQEQNSNQTGMQGQNMSQVLSTFGLQGLQQQQRSQPQTQSQSQSHQHQQYQHQGQQQSQQPSSQQVSGETQDQQQPKLQQLLSSMSPGALFNMLRKSSS